MQCSWEWVFTVDRVGFAVVWRTSWIPWLDSAQAVRESTESRLQHGLATLPEVALARQQEVQALFDLEDVRARDRDAQVALAESVGVPPRQRSR